MTMQYAHNHIDVIRAAQAGDQAARDEIVLGYRHMVYRYAAKLARSYGLDLEDLANAGYLAVLQAIDKYQADRGKLSSYLRAAIKLNVVRAAEDMMGLPPNTLFGRQYLAEQAPERQALLEWVVRCGPKSLDAPILNNVTLADLLPDSERSDDLALNELAGEEVRILVGALASPYRARVLWLYFGLGGEAPMSLSEIADLLRCSKQNVALHFHNGLADMRKALVKAKYV